MTSVYYCISQQFRSLISLLLASQYVRLRRRNEFCLNISEAIRDYSNLKLYNRIATSIVLTTFLLEMTSPATSGRQQIANVDFGPYWVSISR